MDTWQADCAAHVKKTLHSNSSLQHYLNATGHSADKEPTLHLAVCIEPYLSYILDGIKTVESRFSSVKCSPFQKVREGDVILLKKAGGPVIGVCRVQSVSFYELDPATFDTIRRKFSEAICADGKDFWERRENASFATLISISDVQRLPPFSVRKRDRRGWVTFSASAIGSQQCLYD